MIEQVFISGQIGKAVYEQNDRYYVLGVEDFHDPVECRPGDISLLFDSGAEFSVISRRNINIADIRGILESNTQAHRALSMTISGLDDDLSAESRLLSIEAAEEFLQEEPVRAFVRARLLARPLPSVADIDGAIRHAESAGAHLVRDVYKEVWESQEVIEVVLKEWRETAPEFFHSIEEEATGEKVLIEAGVFAEMVAALASADRNSLNSLVVTFGMKPELTKAMTQAVHILNALRMRLLDKVDTVAKRAATSGGDEEHPNVSDIAGIEHSEEGYTETSERILNLIAQFDRRRRWKPSRPHEVEVKIKNQLESISALIHKGDLDRANKFLYDLIEFHLDHSKKEHVAMSLCSLAKTALDSHALDLADELVEYAFSLEVEDAVIPRTQAEILRAKGRSNEALKVYEETMNRFPDDAVSYNGYAEVLKDIGQFKAALAVYRETMNRFPDNVFAYTGYAEVLKAMGRSEDALIAYQEAMNRFPDNAVARTGYAEVLKAMGRSNEALAVYRETMNRFPDNVFAYTGYAEVLKAMGRSNEALAVYRETMNRFPDNAVARSGCASLLVMMGQFNEARSSLSYLSEENITSKDNWIDYHILAMSYLKQGNIDEAIRRLDYGWRNAPWLDVKPYFATALAVARIKKREFDKALEPLMDNVVYLDVFQKQKRLVLIGHSQAGLGNESEAASALAEIKNAYDPHVINLKDALIRRYNIGQEKAELSKIEIADLDNRIDEEEFIIGMAA